MYIIKIFIRLLCCVWIIDGAILQLDVLLLGIFCRVGAILQWSPLLYTTNSIHNPILIIRHKNITLMKSSCLRCPKISCKIVMCRSSNTLQIFQTCYHNKDDNWLTAEHSIQCIKCRNTEWSDKIFQL